MAGVFAPFFPGRKMHYRNQWYVDVDNAPLLFGLGIHGQYLFVDRRDRNRRRHDVVSRGTD